MATDKDDLMNALTDEERAALGEEGIGDDLAAADDIEDVADPVDPPSDTQPTEGQATVPEIELEMAQEIAPPLRASVPDNVQEILEGLAQQQDALAAKFDDGDITAKEYRDEMDKIAAQREDIRWTQRKAELSAEMVESTKREAWIKEVNDFMTTGPGAVIAKSQVQMVAFDNIVRAVTADPANANLSDRAQLQKAFRLFKEDVQRTFGVDPEAGAPQTKQQPTQPQAPARAPRAVVPTLANVPAAEPETLDQGKFSALDRLASTDPIAYERAVARLSEAERAQFEAVA